MVAVIKKVGLCALTWCLSGCVLIKPVMYKGAALYGCTTPMQVVASDRVRRQTDIAIRLWRERLGWTPFQFEEAPTKINIFVDEEEMKHARTHYGSKDGCSSVITIGVGPSILEEEDCRLLWVMAHELGHALGLAHSKHKGDLMHRYTPVLCHRYIGRVSNEEVELIERLQQSERKSR